MTLKEVVAMREPEKIDDKHIGGVDRCPHEYSYLNVKANECFSYHTCDQCWNREFKGEFPKKTPSIVAYDEDGLYLSNGEKVTAPFGYKFNPDDIKKILEAGD